MEELFKFAEKHWILSIIIILGMLDPGIVFIFLWDSNMFWSEDMLKLLILSSAIMCVLYVYNFILVYIGHLVKPIEKSIQGMEMEKMIFPIICAMIELGVVVFFKLFTPFGMVVTKECGIWITLIVSVIFQISYRYIQKK